jgi:peptidoglycan/xylan/chitin deacetylase (PgdA/CDA1 family)
VWLTFDDGPHPEHTPIILEELDKRSIKATFFVIGERAEKHIDIVECAYRAGHGIGNHSFSHTLLTELDRSGIREEILRTQNIIGRFEGKEKVFRPPHGVYNRCVASVAAEHGYKIILWNSSAHDSSNKMPRDRWTRRGLWSIRLRGASTVLLHDNRAHTANHLGQFLDTLQGLHGVRFMTPASLAASPGCAIDSIGNGSLVEE